MQFRLLKKDPIDVVTTALRDGATDSDVLDILVRYGVEDTASWLLDHAEDLRDAVVPPISQYQDAIARDDQAAIKHTRTPALPQEDDFHLPAISP